ncbi:DJ-1 family protein [Gregarina niphandrodes]|uniref:DJ-1 family protein n=1 Tax=Gregarina niphandrodes TaxID=110365 RepID=A0A023AYR3_GRENI|nr:DJ-1 family protein [Gregarina niphandrodes]EZG43410.1 DJ-1 family protein [Gregarina niphandrodes]|eukprot:XP_011133351.1 DJ-1 family protein [Gregarina niphandrodes]
MSVKALVLLADGFETVEACFPIDILVRCGYQVSTASVSTASKKQARSAHNVVIQTDGMVEDMEDQSYDVIVLPGGMPGATTLGKSATVKKMLQNQADKKRWIAAICAAPAEVLAANNLLGGAKGVCYPAEQFQKAMGDSLVHGHVYTDDAHRLITGDGPASAALFGFTIAKHLGTPQDKINQLSSGMVFDQQFFCNQ